MRRERLLIGAGKADLADRGSSLALVERERARREAKHPAPECYRAGGDEDHIRPAPLRRGDIVGQRAEPAGAQAAVAVDEERRADLHDQPPRGADVGFPDCHQGCHAPPWSPAVSSAPRSSAMMR